MASVKGPAAFGESMEVRSSLDTCTLGTACSSSAKYLQARAKGAEGKARQRFEGGGGEAGGGWGSSVTGRHPWHVHV